MFEIDKLLGKLKLGLLEATVVVIGSGYTNFSTAIFPVQSLPTTPKSLYLPLFRQERPSLQSYTDIQGLYSTTINTEKYLH